MIATRPCLDQGHTSDTADTDPIVVDCIGEVMEQDQTWSGVVEVGCTLNVRSHLIVEPGTVVRLVAGGGLVFADGGSIDAVGDVDRPITMTSDGGFASLVFLEPDVPSTLAFVNVSGGGVPGIVYGEGMAIVGDSAFAAGNVSIRDCVFEGSASVGIDLRWGKASIERTRVVGSVGPSVVTSL